MRQARHCQDALSTGIGVPGAPGGVAAPMETSPLAMSEALVGDGSGTPGATGGGGNAPDAMQPTEVCFFYWPVRTHRSPVMRSLCNNFCTPLFAEPGRKIHTHRHLRGLIVALKQAMLKVNGWRGRNRAQT